jgi:glucuronoarabinoxylan endo-1,4-beta-xylanase
MKPNPLNGLVLLSLCLYQVLLCVRVQAQTVVARGTVSTSTTPVRYASVTFEATNAPANKCSALTDSLGHYRLEIILTSVKPSSALPTKFKLEQNYPNPFSSSTVVSYQLRTQTDIQVTIYDILGREIRRFAAGAQTAGTHSVLWDGRNNLGQRVAGGTYFYSLQTGGEFQAKKMVLSAGSSGPIPLPQEHSTPMAQLGPQMSQLMPGGIFTVRIENTINTSPLISSSQSDNVVIQNDTTLDFPVSPLPVATVYLDSVQQYVRGFGGANILNWRPDMTTDQVQKAFGTGKGQLGFTILRLRIPYTESVSEFSAQVPTAKLAQSLGAIVFASPWTPPPALKSNNNIVGGVLNDSSYAAYAAHLKAFADYMASNGAPLYAVSLQNEPDANVIYESCSWNATQFLNFTRNNASSIGTRIMMPESQNFVHRLSDSTLLDLSAVANVAIIGGHIYGGGLTPYPLAVSKGKEVWMTEHLVLDTSWTAVLATGREIHDCMNAGMNAYVWWYIVRYYGPIGEDGNVTKRGYVMSQYARFIRPGFHKIQCNPTSQRNLFLSSYKDSSSSKVVIVAFNMSTSAIQQAFSVTNGKMTSFASYTTSQTKNCAEGVDIPVANGSFAVSLDPSSITTFVSK